MKTIHLRRLTTNVATFCVSRPTIGTVAKTYAQNDLEQVLKLKRSINSDNARRKVDGRMEAKIEFGIPVIREAIRKSLKKPA